METSKDIAIRIVSELFDKDDYEEEELKQINSNLEKRETWNGIWRDRFKVFGEYERGFIDGFYTGLSVENSFRNTHPIAKELAMMWSYQQFKNKDKEKETNLEG